MTVTYHDAFDQGSQHWLDARCGLLTASEMKLILTPTLKVASNDKERAHLYELLAQRITKYVEPRYVSDDMLRGQCDEITARQLYAKHYAPVTECGFVTNNKWGFTIGYSPDALVGGQGLIECKSRRQRFQVETFIGGEAPADFMMQCQTGMLVAEREWLDFVSYSAGLPLFVCRVWPDEVVQNAIVEAAGAFEARLSERLATYRAALASAPKLIETERTIEQEMTI
jgi:hypothetical protein